jgi:hypothetical protein
VECQKAEYSCRYRGLIGHKDQPRDEEGIYSHVLANRKQPFLGHQEEKLEEG